MRVGGGQYGRNLSRREKIQEADIAGARGSRLDLRALCPVADEDQAGTFAREAPRGGNERVPSAVETEIARMDQDK